VKPLRFFAFNGFYNPFAPVYMLLRVLTRLILGRYRRDNIFRIPHWGTLLGFLDWMRLPEVLFESFMAKEVKLRVKRKYFRREPVVSSFLINKHGHIFIDIGANFGYYSFLLHNNFDTILAIEPYIGNVRVIEIAKEKYGYNRVNILPTAISDKDGKAKLYLSSFCCGHSLVPKLKSNHINVNTITLDSLLKTSSDIDLIKVDVEGAEWEVLNGTKNVMSKIKSWLIELHDTTRKNELKDLLKSYGYVVRWVDRNHIFAWRPSFGGEAHG